MKKFVFTILCLLLGALLPALGDEVPARRIALLNTGPGDGLPAGLLPLLEARLLEQADRVTLLERAQVDRLLREQALGLAEGRLDGAAAMRAGELWGVDAFCLLAREENNLRVQVVDTWHGIRMMDVSIPLPRATELDSAANMITARLLQRLPAVTRDPGELRLAGVLDIKSTEPSRRHEELGRSIRTALEQQVMFLPDLILAEREQAQPLVDERELVSAFPERIRTSVVLVTGEWHFDHADPDKLHLYLQGRRHGERIFRLQMEGHRQDLELLGRHAAVAIAEALGKVEALAEMDPRLEADMLLAQSKASQDSASSMGAAAAARALMPDDDAYELAWLEAHSRWSHRMPIEASAFQRYLDRSRPFILASLENSDFDTEKRLGYALTFLQRYGHMLQQLQEASPEERRDLHRQVLDLFEQSWAVYQANENPPQDKVPPLRDGTFFEAYSRIRPLDAEAAYRFYTEVSEYKSLRTLARMSSNMVWPEALPKAEALQRHIRFYTWMRSREDTATRLAGQRGLARMYADPYWGANQPEKAREHFEAYLEIYLNEYIPGLTLDQGRFDDSGEYSFLGFGFAPFLNSRGFQTDRRPARYFEDDQENLAYRADHIEHVLRRVLTDPAFPPRIDWASSGELLAPVRQAGRHLVQAELLQLQIDYLKRGHRSYTGNVQGSQTLLEFSISQYENTLRRIRESHPELFPTPSTPSPYSRGLEARRLFSLQENLQELGASGLRDIRSLVPSRLILEHGMAAVLCSNGILHLDPGSLMPLRYQPAPEGMSLRNFYAADDTGIYTVAPSGIIHFPKTGDAAGYFQNHPDLSTRYYGVDVLDHRIYLLTSEANHVYAQNALEFDLEKGTRKIVLSVKSELRDSAMEGLQDIYIVMSEPWAKRLYFSVRKNIRGVHSTPVYLYDPESGSFSDAGSLNPFSGSILRRRGMHITNVTTRSVVFKNLSRRRTPLLRYWNDEHRFHAYQTFVQTEKGLVGILQHTGELNFFPVPGAEIQRIKHEVFPPAKGPAPTLRDMVMHPELGLVLLGNDGLYAVPAIRPPTGNMAAPDPAPAPVLEVAPDLARRRNIEQHGLDFVLYSEAQALRVADHPHSFDFTNVPVAFDRNAPPEMASIRDADFAAARELYLRVARLFPGNPYAESSRFYAAICLVHLGKADEALQELSRFIQDDPDGLKRGEAWLRMGDIRLFHQWDSGKAHEAYREAAAWFTVRNENPLTEKTQAVPERSANASRPPQVIRSRGELDQTRSFHIPPTALINRNTAEWYLNHFGVETQWRLGFLAILADDWELAFEHFDRVLEADPVLRRIQGFGGNNPYSRLKGARLPNRGLIGPLELQHGLEGVPLLMLSWADFYLLRTKYDKALDLYSRIQQASAEEENKTVHTRAVLGEMLTRQQMRSIDPKRDVPRMRNLVRDNPDSPSAPNLLEVSALFSDDAETRQAIRDMIYENYPQSNFAIRARYQKILYGNWDHHDLRARMIEEFKSDFPTRVEYHTALDRLDARIREIKLQNSVQP